MRATRAIAVACLSSFMFAGCAMSRPYKSVTYVVHAQDTLYSIAWRHDLDYRQLAKWNNIGADYRVTVGQVLLLVPPGGGAPSRANSSVPLARSTPTAPTAPTAPATPRVAVATPPSTAQGVLQGAAKNVPLESSASAGHLKWVWPTDRQSAPVAVPSGGILLLGKLGQDIRAAGSGRVVYTGSGIRGYGNLIIIKHGDTLLSSYAHNREMLVHEGQDVLAGQTIAHMGTGAHQVSALYFEIRLNGKPTDPLRYLAPP